MVDDAQTHLLPTEAGALDNVARLHGLADGDDLIALVRPQVEAAGELFDGLMPDTRAILSNDPDILRGELAQLGFADAQAAARLVGERRSGKARALRSPAAQAAFEAMLPALTTIMPPPAPPEDCVKLLDSAAPPPPPMKILLMAFE